MALKNNFYTEIFDNEEKWIELINDNLLNSIYCNLVLKPFYEEKKKELQQEYDLTQNQIIGHIIIVIENIINQINLFKDQYDKSQNVNIKFILPLFLTNQMNNKDYVNNSMFNNIKNKNNGKQIIKIKNSDEFDYIYDDFPEEVKRIK